MSTTSPIFALPAPELTDAANIEDAITPLRDRIEAVLNALIPVGFLVFDSGSALPTLEGWVWDYADGGLIDRTTYAAFFGRIGHAYNGGVDPGSNKVRKPDKRGRGIVGPDNMGTVQGAAGRLPNSNRAVGQGGGIERATVAAANLPTAFGTLTVFGNEMNKGAVGEVGSGDRPASATTPARGGGYSFPFGQVTNVGGGNPLSVMQPYEVDNVYVRIA